MTPPNGRADRDVFMVDAGRLFGTLFSQSKTYRQSLVTLAALSLTLFGGATYAHAATSAVRTPSELELYGRMTVGAFPDRTGKAGLVGYRWQPTRDVAQRTVNGKVTWRF